MDQGRYSMTLDDIPPWISRVVRKGVPYGYASRTVKPGYLLTDGTALLESERDENGFYTGGAGMDGMYLPSWTKRARSRRFVKWTAFSACLPAKSRS